jgi:putative iron-regulated protein
LIHYSDLAHAIFQDSRAQAETLQLTINALLDQPNDDSLNAAKKAWKQARIPYQQSEVFRFSHRVVDDLEAQLNAWPLDEGLIDYVADSYEAELGNMGAEANIIANPRLDFGGAIIDSQDINPEVLAELNELGGSEANVASGYHAIEFLLWGQDLNGTNDGAGERPASDYSLGEQCTHKNCDRRRAYLAAASQLLIDDLRSLENAWAANAPDNYRDEFLRLSDNQGITKILYAMGSLALGELAGERMKVALEANSTEDEHDCFSDNTHYSHYYDALGIDNIYRGHYQNSQGTWMKGPALADLVAASNPSLNKNMSSALEHTQAALQTMVDRAEATGPFSQQATMKFDQMIAEGNREGERIIASAIESLVAQTQILEQVAATLEIKSLTSDNANSH